MKSSVRISGWVASLIALVLCAGCDKYSPSAATTSPQPLPSGYQAGWTQEKIEKSVAGCVTTVSDYHPEKDEADLQALCACAFDKVARRFRLDEVEDPTPEVSRERLKLVVDCATRKEKINPPPPKTGARVK